MIIEYQYKDGVLTFFDDDEQIAEITHNDEIRKINGVMVYPDADEYIDATGPVVYRRRNSDQS